MLCENAARVMIILNLSENIVEFLDYSKRRIQHRMYYSDRSEIRDRICQKERTDIHIWTKLSI